MAEVLVQVLASGAIYLGSYHIYRVKKLVAVSRDVCEHLRLTNEWIAERLERPAPPRPVTQPDYYDWLIDKEQRIVDLLSQMQDEEKCVGECGCLSKRGFLLNPFFNCFRKFKNEPEIN